jgi:hypothetical protein
MCDIETLLDRAGCLETECAMLISMMRDDAGVNTEPDSDCPTDCEALS